MIFVCYVRIPSNYLSEINGVAGVCDGIITNGVGEDSIELLVKFIRENSSMGHVMSKDLNEHHLIMINALHLTNENVMVDHLEAGYNHEFLIQVYLKKVNGGDKTADFYFVSVVD